ncbi:MAG: flagellar biosynthesis anti-sigma factor FlgM [Piscirickettsiaceae bacterium]|nr:MAG: flagellar biosynthesis anti-sigma factor FlgM [Piscirickettsiaceae bacterium]
MSINIKGVSGKGSQTSTRKVSGDNKASKSSSNVATQKPQDDSVDLTEAASRIQSIEQSLSNIPIIDDTRVESISNSINDGSYTVDNEKIADQIIASEEQIIKTQNRQKT